ncbi:hypothetical protein F7R01_00775 [Pseudomonas argentinensis]|uniref:Uncharacterized protein n=1 Tax=Phytopseudomonas argentinensis TaxID=289370 RepID=A0A1I3NVC5_9GAMM|nr:hypothetical protein [Pseudomonas argentinensis]KAB0549790.1 hypothetical protein F7R01_00775 [Pseudomonas argentinensis]SFJ12726.1 hypothetical protein SAMN05216602_4022 [Pseudomonas argentinensis]
MASPTIEDLLALAKAAPRKEDPDFPGGRIWTDAASRYVDLEIYMFGDPIEMAKALIGQIHALQDQIRTMRAEQENR